MYFFKSSNNDHLFFLIDNLIIIISEILMISLTKNFNYTTKIELTLYLD